MSAILCEHINSVTYAKYAPVEVGLKKTKSAPLSAFAQSK